jgi:hypothetical protein
MEVIMKIVPFIMIFLYSNLLYGQQIIKNLQWLNGNKEVTELTVDNGITLYADTENVNDGEIVKITIWEENDESDDLVGEYFSRVKGNKIIFHWILTFEEEKLQNCSNEIKTIGFTMPEYYFTIEYTTIETQHSKLLNVRGWIRQLIITEVTEIPCRNTKYALLLPDNTEIEGWTDAEGYIRQDNIKVFGREYLFYFLEDGGEEHESELAYQKPQKPIYYRVKENDNLWKIAGYDFIYGNSYLWEKLYEANKHNFVNEGDPNFILKDQVLIIPAIGSEIREGTR